jgi:hypothetical protein
MMKLLLIIPALLTLPACQTPKILQNLKASVKLHGTMNDLKDEFEIKECEVLVQPKSK